MSWFPKFFGKKSTQPRDSQAPLKSLMANAPKAGGQMGENARMKRELLGSFKKGGIVKKTGAYKLHKGEEVIPANVAAKKREISKKMKVDSKKKKNWFEEQQDRMVKDWGHKRKDLMTAKEYQNMIDTAKFYD